MAPQMRECWIPGFISGNAVVFAEGSEYELATRDVAADEAERLTPGKPLVVGHQVGQRIMTFEAKRDADGKWVYTTFPDLSRVFSS